MQCVSHGSCIICILVVLCIFFLMLNKYSHNLPELIKMQPVFFYNEILEHTRLKTCPLRIIIKVFTIGLKCPPPPPLSTRLYRPPIGRLPSVFATPNLILTSPNNRFSRWLSHHQNFHSGLRMPSYSITIDFCSLRDLSFDSLSSFDSFVISG
ncbi:hypothetical protein L2E82_39823 [Cichorium intybus]|uniref:Uncharacterized protein n=1 Tax=Cichorium intybus TaxID=13427 RepID=A0ACB9ANN7_CICIN|nr:hypothetical protein L2E82_39823 [Cichorium intybus]